MNSKNIGELSEALILTEFLKRNIPVSLPWGDNQPYDMIIDYKGDLYKIQCKTGRSIKEGESFTISFRSTYSNKNHTYVKYYNETIDLFAAAYENKVYLIPITNVNQTAIQLRLIPCKNNQNKGINWAKDYELDTQLNLLSNFKEER